MDCILAGCCWGPRSLITSDANHFRTDIFKKASWQKCVVYKLIGIWCKVHDFTLRKALTSHWLDDRWCILHTIDYNKYVWLVRSKHISVVLKRPNWLCIGTSFFFLFFSIELSTNKWQYSVGNYHIIIVILSIINPKLIILPILYQTKTFKSIISIYITNYENTKKNTNGLSKRFGVNKYAFKIANYFRRF